MPDADQRDDDAAGAEDEQELAALAVDQRHADDGQPGSSPTVKIT